MKFTPSPIHHALRRSASLLLAAGLSATGPLSAADSPAPRITVDAAKTAVPMAPEIYSQFIEHLGRCIYGGIWAEMLEDRKFHFPVTADYHPYRKMEDTPYPVVGASPWQIIGTPELVSNP